MRGMTNKENPWENKSTEKYLSHIEQESLQLLEVVEETKGDMEIFYPQMVEEAVSETEIQGKVDSLKRATVNISKALSKTYVMSDELNTRHNDIQKQKKKHKLSFNAPANATIDIEEKESQHFARGMNLYKLLLVCFIGSFVGVVIELIWCLLKNGYLESRSGLIYGPFNLVYGAGAVGLTICLYPFRNRSSWLSFLGGAVVGSVVEYMCSWMQELIFGSRSWDYSNMPFNINGRICLLYSVFWGFLGVLWIKNLYPRMAKWILKIPNHVGRIVTWVLVIFFIFNACVSLISVCRWAERLDGQEPSNSFEEFIDERFPDERMERVFANMEFVKNAS